MKLSSDPAIFSDSDDEYGTLAGRVMDVVQDSTTTKIAQGQLLPSAGIKERSLDNEDDRLTTSPKKLTHLMKLVYSPQRSPLQPHEKKNITKDLRALMLPESQRRSITISPKVSPKVQRDWDHLFDSIQPQPVNNVPLSSEEEEEQIQDDSIKVNLSFIFNSLESKQDVVVKSEKKIHSPRRSGRCYGDQRSYRIENDERQDVHDIESDSDISNINDLRKLGKNNRDQEEIDYILEGLVTNNFSLLTASLLDLAHLVTSGKANIMENSLVILASIQGIKQKNALNDWLIKVILYLFIKEDSYPIADYSHEITNMLTDFLDNVELNGLLNISRTSLNQLQTKIPSSKEIKISIIDSFKHDGLFMTIQNYEVVSSLYDTVDLRGKLVILSFYEAYFTDSRDVKGFENIASLVEDTIGNLEAEKYTHYELAIMKLLVLITTNYRNTSVLYESKNIPILISVVNQVLVSSTHISTNIALFILGYLINFMEADTYTVEDFGPITKNINLVQEFLARDESSVHLKGYNSILLGYIKIRHDIGIEAPQLIDWLADFRTNIENKAVQHKITIIIHELEPEKKP